MMTNPFDKCVTVPRQFLLLADTGLSYFGVTILSRRGSPDRANS